MSVISPHGPYVEKVLIYTVSRSQQLRYGKLALGSAPSFAFTARSPHVNYGTNQDDGYDDEDEDDLGSDEDTYGYDDEETIDEIEDEGPTTSSRRTSGVFYSDPVNSTDSPTGPSRGPRLKHIRAARRHLGPGQFDFTATPESIRQYDDIPGTASLATSPSSHIYLPPSVQRNFESTPLLSDANTTPRRLGFEDSPAPDSVASRRQSTIGRRRVSGAAARRMSMDRRSVRSRRSVVVEVGESTDGQTVSTAGVSTSCHADSSSCSIVLQSCLVSDFSPCLWHSTTWVGS